MPLGVPSPDQLRSRQPLTVVYSPGKAGTATIVRSLRQSSREHWIGDVRRLTPGGLDDYRAWVLARPRDPDRELREDDSRVGDLLRSRPELTVRLVTPIREPVAAAISSFFWNFELRHPGVDIDTCSLNDLRDEILEGNYATRRDYFTSWFDFELQRFTGIDVYTTDFPRSVGFTTIRHGRFHLLVLRVEDLNRVHRVAFSSIGIHMPRLAADAHRGIAQPYAARYEGFKRLARFPREWLDGQLNSRYAEHFYGDDVIRNVRKRWLERPAPPRDRRRRVRAD